MSTTSKCSWVTEAGTKCKNVVLMDGFCSRHLKQKCSICWDQVRSTNSANTKRLSCGHSFHLNCILQWFVKSNECPVCRQEQIKDPIILYKEKIQEELREIYRDAMKTYEVELTFLRRRLR